jgi:hypothetical protein
VHKSPNLAALGSWVRLQTSGAAAADKVEVCLLARTPTSFRDKSKRKENGGVLAISLSFSLSLLLSFSLFLSFSLVLSLSLTHFFWREIGLKASIFSMKNVLSPLIV